MRSAASGHTILSARHFTPEAPCCRFIPPAPICLELWAVSALCGAACSPCGASCAAIPSPGEAMTPCRYPLAAPWALSRAHPAGAPTPIDGI
jgi:hypothetical protein